MIATRAEVVVDASVVVRGLLENEGSAVDIVDDIASGTRTAHAPDLLVSEVTNALRVRISAGRWPVEAAQERLAAFLDLPIVIHQGGPLASEALASATEWDLSAYDAFYATLADALEIALVTADRHLAAAVAGSVLVG